jgi:hypothetical protein
MTACLEKCPDRIVYNLPHFDVFGHHHD